MNGFRLWLQGFVFLMAISGCSALKLSHYDRLNPEPLNPYLRYLSSEPYWHYNFYPEPRWEYTHGLYSYPTPFSATLYSCHEKDNPHWHNRHHRDSTLHKPKTGQPVKTVKMPDPVKRPTLTPGKHPPSSQPPKQLELIPVKAGASKSEKMLKPVPSAAPDNQVTGKPTPQAAIDLKNKPDSPDELEKPPGLSAGVIHPNDSSRQTLTHNLPADRNKASAGGEPMDGYETPPTVSRNNAKLNKDTLEVIVTNPRKVTTSDGVRLPKRTGISSPSTNRVLEKSPTISIEPSTRDTILRNRNLQDSAVRIDNSSDRSSKPVDISTFEPPNRQVRAPNQGRIEPESAGRFNPPNKSAISENFDRKTELMKTQPSLETVRRESNSIRDIARTSEPPARHETPPNREINRAIEIVPARHESPPAPPVQKSEPATRPVLRAESANTGSANGQPNNGMSKKR